MNEEVETAEALVEDASQRGQTTLTEFFQTRFKGQPTKGAVPVKHAAAPIKQTAATVMYGRIALAAKPDAAGSMSNARSSLPPSVKLSLCERIAAARSVQERNLEEICCHHKVSHRRSVGVVCRGPSDKRAPSTSSGKTNPRVSFLLCCSPSVYYITCALNTTADFYYG